MGILVALPIAAAIAVLDRRKIEDFFLLAIGIIIMCVLMSGYALGSTVPGVKVGVAVGVVSALYCLVMLFIDHERFKNSVLTPGLWVMLIAAAVSGALLINKTDLGDANDTFWAHIPQVLNMYRNSNIGNVGRVSVNYDLLYNVPVFTSWCYFCNMLWPSYSDGINLWARQIFIMAAFMPFFSFVGKRGWKNVLLISLVIMLIPGMIRPQYDFMLDIPMGAMMIYGTIMTQKLFRDTEKYNDGWYLLGGGLCLLFTYLMKRMGGVYAFSMIGLAAIYTVDRIRSVDREHSFFKKIAPITALLIPTLFSMYFFDHRNEAQGFDFFVTLLPLIIFPVFLLMGLFCSVIKHLSGKKKYLSVLALLLLFYAAALWVIPFTAELIRKILDDVPGDIRGIFYDFFSMWFTAVPGEKRFNGGWFMSDLVFVVILLLVLLAIRRCISLKKLLFTGTAAELDNVITVVFIGYTVYMLFYLFLCVYRQGDYASDGDIYWTMRYHGPAVMLVAAMTLYELLGIKSIHSDKILMCAAAFLMLLLPTNPFMVMDLSREPYWDKYDEMCRKAGVELTEDDNVFCIGPDHVYYYTFPAKAYQDYYVINAKVEPDVFSWKANMFDYLLIEEHKGRFAEAYQDMFVGGIDSIQDYSIYDINVDEEGNVTFSKLEAGTTE